MGVIKKLLNNYRFLLQDLRKEHTLLFAMHVFFVGADLSGADLSYTDLSGANLSDANLSGADLSGANLNCKNHSICLNE